MIVIHVGTTKSSIHIYLVPYTIGTFLHHVHYFELSLEKLGWLISELIGIVS